MHLLVTDSGVGGLSVCGHLERFLASGGGPAGPARLTFANAAPRNDYGYNSMPTVEVRLAAFDRFLRRVVDRFAPDAIFVACNSLSVLLPEVPWVQSAGIPVRGIVETAVSQLHGRWRGGPGAAVVIFATPTTIASEAYPRALAARGVERSRIVAQACPGLADVISEDRAGERSAAAIREWVRTACGSLPAGTTSVVAGLACTHYGYRVELFAAAFAELGLAAEIVDPNADVAANLFPAGSGTSPVEPRDVPIEVVSPYAIPPPAIEALTVFLERISPPTVRALHRFRQVPDLA